MEFRESALAKLAEPEELDVPVRLTGPRVWLILAATAFVMLAGGVWAFTGTVPQRVTAPGLLIYPGGGFRLESTVTGQVSRILVQTGKLVAAGTPIANVAVDRGVETVRAATPGKISQILAQPGAVVTTRAPLAVAERAGADDRLVAVVYLPSRDVAQVRPGNAVDIAVASAPAGTYGTLRGSVDSLGTAPESREQIAAFLGDEELAGRFAAGQPVLKAVVRLNPAATASGYAWSTGNGPPFELACRTPAGRVRPPAAVPPDRPGPAGMTPPVAVITAGRHRMPAATVRPPKPAPGQTRTPVVLQMEAVECGPAALATVLAHHGRHVPLEELRLVCGVSRNGSKASMLIKAANAYGLAAKGMQMEADDLAEVAAPAVLFWNFEHFVVWEGYGRRLGRRVMYINDPAGGRRTVDADEFDRSFTGVVLTFAPGPGFRRGGHRPGALADVPRRLRSTVDALLIAVFASLLLAVVGMVRPGFILAVVQAMSSDNRSVPWPLFALMAAAVVATAALTATQQAHLARMQVVLSTLGHARFLRHLMRLPVSFFAQRGRADLTRRLRSNGVMAEILARDVAAVLINAVLVVAYAALMWAYDVQLAVVGALAALFNVVALRLVTRVRESGVAKLQIDRAKFFTASVEGLQLIETMKATGGEKGYFRRWAGLHSALLVGQQRVGTPSAFFATIAPALAMLSSAVVLLIGGLRAVEGQLAVGLLVAFQALLIDFSRPVGELCSVASRVQDFGADTTRLRDVENFPPDPVFSRPEPPRVQRLEGYLELDGVIFGYSPLGEPLLSDVSLTVAPGQQVALVGGSGSGKSTTVRLIAGLYTPWSGQIRLDGTPRDEIPRSVLAASVAFVDQELYLFDGTVRDNVTLWDPSIPDEDVVAALRDAALYDVVAARPGGIHSRVEQNGRNFSGGQRQRLEIARALVRQPSVLVLDEATSALDTETEQIVSANLRRRGCACVVIAHRLSTIRDSDEIVVLDRGTVVERGRHADLMAAGGAYAELVTDH